MKIVAPAGDYEKFEASIKAGADEIYFGIKGFGARRKNQNFDLTEMFESIDYAHARGIKTSITLNTLMKDHEIDAFYNNISRIYEHGIDCIIVQDLGFFSFLKQNFPNVKFHGSTQMTVANHIEANYLQSIGFDRVVLARELSFEEIKKIRENTSIELEVFVSGSLCISYSGNCYLSSYIGGRSGNRGMCAYTCRKKLEDENKNKSYFLSPNDQFLKKEEIEMLEKIGINAIKIEGRKKSKEYAFETVSYYKSVLEQNEKNWDSYKIFNRGYSKGYFYKDNKLMNFNYSSNFGYLIGEIKQNNDILLKDTLILGDGIQYVDEKYDKISGEYVNKILINKEKVKKANKGDLVNLGIIPKNTKYIYKNFSKEVIDNIDNKIITTNRRKSINGELYIEQNKKVTLKFYTYSINNEKIEATGEGELVEDIAQKEITKDTLYGKISELGDTPFFLDKLDIHYDLKSFVSFKSLKNLKREVAAELEKKLINSYRRLQNKKSEKIFTENKKESEIVISALVDTKEKEDLCREYGIDKIYYKQYDVATEKNLDKIDLNSKLASNLYQVIENKNENISVDWNLNIFNNYTLDLYSKIDNVETVFLSPELNFNELKFFKNNNVKKGLVIYGNLLSMYIEYPIFKEKEKSLLEEHGDVYIVRKNDLNNTELYLKEPMNIVSKIDELEQMNFDELRLDFILDDIDEVKSILKDVKAKKSKYTPYSYERGVY